MASKSSSIVPPHNCGLLFRVPEINSQDNQYIISFAKSDYDDNNSVYVREIMNTMFGYIPPNNVIQLSQTL
ncbi:hypothetical protein LASHA2_27060 [Lactiplantibacillus plantarum]